ncbi:MAG: nucleotide pyrophosphohydrolase [Bdellovibrionales bacterium]|nr:nucleotide pyrophosphohydrolase [Bdellovibrionales bacterium]
MKNLTLHEILSEILEFRDERDWKQFHRPKDMAISLMLESAEVAENFQWKTDQETAQLTDCECQQIGEELADVLYWTVLIANDLGVDLASAFQAKMQKNRAKYPLEKAKGKSLKYTKLS